MDATTNKSGVTGEVTRVNAQSVREKLKQVRDVVGDPARAEFLPPLDTALQAFWDVVPFEVTVGRPRTFAQFLALTAPTQGLFNQLASEVPFWTLLDQIEESCFLQPGNLAIASSFLGEPWASEVAANPFKVRKDWCYLSVPEAVEAFRKIFGSSLKADHTLKLAAQARPRGDSEGVPTWIKLTTLARLLEVSGNPLDVTDEGRAAYAHVVDLMIPMVGEAFVKTYPKSGFNNWRKGALTGKHVVLTSAGIATWRKSEAVTVTVTILVGFNRFLSKNNNN